MRKLLYSFKWKNLEFKNITYTFLEFFKLLSCTELCKSLTVSLKWTHSSRFYMNTAVFWLCKILSLDQIICINATPDYFPSSVFPGVAVSEVCWCFCRTGLEPWGIFRKKHRWNVCTFCSASRHIHTWLAFTDPNQLWMYTYIITVNLKTRPPTLPIQQLPCLSSFFLPFLWFLSISLLFL